MNNDVSIQESKLKEALYDTESLVQFLPFWEEKQTDILQNIQASSNHDMFAHTLIETLENFSEDFSRKPDNEKKEFFGELLGVHRCLSSTIESLDDVIARLEELRDNPPQVYDSRAYQPTEEDRVAKINNEIAFYRALPHSAESRKVFVSSYLLRIQGLKRQEKNISLISSNIKAASFKPPSQPFQSLVGTERGELSGAVAEAYREMAKNLSELGRQLR